MIYGKTTEQSRTDRWVFCWLPVWLDDGRWLWLQRAWKEHGGISNCWTWASYHGRSPK